MRQLERNLHNSKLLHIFEHVMNKSTNEATLTELISFLENINNVLPTYIRDIENGILEINSSANEPN